MRGRIWAPSASGETSSIAGHWFGVLGLMLAACVSMLAAPFASAEELPNGRVYEMVSPVKKNGNSAGAIGYGALFYARSTADGSRLLYGSSGTLEGGKRGMQTNVLGNRTANGWRNSDPMPYPDGQVNYINYGRYALQASTDLTRFAFEMSGGGLVPGNPRTPVGPEESTEHAGALYITEPATELTSWVTEPKIPSPLPAIGHTEWVHMVPVGQSPDLHTFYFSYIGTLVPEDASRAPNVNPSPKEFEKTPRALYRWSDGELVNYGSLPDGSYDPFGAVQAGGATNLYQNNSYTPGTFNGQVSGDGQQAVFLSPDPTSGSGRAAQLYVRRGDAPSVLVTRSEVTGLPSASGPFQINPARPASGETNYAYAYGSLDGSHVFFESVDALTTDAPVSATEKAYLFDVESGDLQYLPGVRGVPVAAAPDLSAFVFGRMATSFGAQNGEVGVWDGTTASSLIDKLPNRMVLNGRASADGNILVFETNATIPGFNNGNGFTEEVYRYDVAAAQLSCVSCPPEGITPESNAQVGHNQTAEPQVPADGKLYDSRGISADGQRVFFDTGDPLVKKDANGQRDVYMWENGKVSLISSGRSGKESYYLENSESGDDVFFTTTEALNPEDTDGAYDVYDARVNGGFSIAPPPAACSGAGCQAIEVSPSFSDPGSSDLVGAGNAKQRSKPKKSRCAKSKVSKQGKCVKKKQRKSQKRTATTKQGGGK